jgi:hypothetical protein
MGIVTEHLISLIAKQVEDRRLVVWYDPERAYTQAARRATPWRAGRAGRWRS